VSPVCLGIIGGDGARLVAAAIEAGINFFFLSTDLHWPSYDALRNGIRAYLRGHPRARDRIVIAAVSYAHPLEFVVGARWELLGAMPELKRLDVLVAGGLCAGDSPRRLEGLRDPAAPSVGARAVGASFHDRALALEACNGRRVDLAWVRYNPLHRGAAQSLLPAIDGDAPALVYNFNSTHGRLGDRAWSALRLDDYYRPPVTDYYRYALSVPRMNGILVSLQNVRQLRELDDALGRGPLSREDAAHLENIVTLAQRHEARAEARSRSGQAAGRVGSSPQARASPVYERRRSS
jgi:hypothetical protein